MPCRVVYRPQCSLARRVGGPLRVRGDTVANSAKHADLQYRKLAPLVRAAANADPSTRCRRCGLTLVERRRTHPRDVWQCGHPDRPGDVGYAPECRSCNTSAGATDGNKRRSTGYDWP